MCHCTQQEHLFNFIIFLWTAVLFHHSPQPVIARRACYSCWVLTLSFLWLGIFQTFFPSVCPLFDGLRCLVWLGILAISRRFVGWDKPAGHPQLLCGFWLCTLVQGKLNHKLPISDSKYFQLQFCCEVQAPPCALSDIIPQELAPPPPP